MSTWTDRHDDVIEAAISDNGSMRISSSVDVVCYLCRPVVGIKCSKSIGRKNSKFYWFMCFSSFCRFFLEIFFKHFEKKKIFIKPLKKQYKALKLMSLIILPVSLKPRPTHDPVASTDDVFVWCVYMIVKQGRHNERASHVSHQGYNG